MSKQIIDIFFSPSTKEYTAQSVYQYDRGLKLRIYGLTTEQVVEFQYGIKGISQTLNNSPEYVDQNWISNVPDVLLSQTQEIMCYVCISDAESVRTVFHIRIPIIAREKPADYQYSEQEISSYNELMAKLQDAVNAVTELNSQVENSTQEAQEAATAANEAAESANLVSTEFETFKSSVEASVSEMSEEINNIIENGVGGVAESVAWDDVTEKPETYPPSEHTHTAEEVGARSDDWMPTPEEIGAVFTERNSTEEDINKPERLTVPLKDKDGYFYPITSYNQIVMPNGNMWDGKASGGTAASVNGVEADENGNIEVSATDVGALATDGSSTMEAPINFETASIGANEDKLLMRKDSDGNEYAIYDEGNKPTAADIGALTINDNGEVVNGDIVVQLDATTFNGMTLEQLKAAVMAEAVYQ